VHFAKMQSENASTSEYMLIGQVRRAPRQVARKKIAIQISGSLSDVNFMHNVIKEMDSDYINHTIPGTKQPGSQATAVANRKWQDSRSVTSTNNLHCS
jgi:hypothetical protein